MSSYTWADHRPVDCLGRVLALEELVEVLRTVRGREPASPSVFRDSYQLQLLIHFHNNIKNSSPYQLVYLWETAALNSHVKDVTRIYRLTRGVDICRFSVKDNSGKQVQKSTFQPNRSSVVTCLIKDGGHCLWEKKQSSISVCQRNLQPQMIENWVPSCSLACTTLTAQSRTDAQEKPGCCSEPKLIAVSFRYNELCLWNRS